MRPSQSSRPAPPESSYAICFVSHQNIGFPRPIILLRHFFLCFLPNLGTPRLLCFLAIPSVVLRLVLPLRWPPQPLGPERLPPHQIRTGPASSSNRSSCFCCFSFLSFSRLRPCCDDDLLIPAREIQVAVEASSRQRGRDLLFHFTVSFVLVYFSFFIFLIFLQAGSGSGWCWLTYAILLLSTTKYSTCQ